MTSMPRVPPAHTSKPPLRLPPARRSECEAEVRDLQSCLKLSRREGQERLAAAEQARRQAEEAAQGALAEQERRRESEVGLHPDAPRVGLDPDAAHVGLDPDAPRVDLDPDAPRVGLDPGSSGHHPPP